MFRMLARTPACALAVTLFLSVAACATDRGRISRLTNDLHDTRMRKVSSIAELDQLVRDGQELTRLREEIELQRKCREHRSGPDRPWACDKRHEGDATVLDRIEVTGSRIKASDLITRNQEAGVDEGDIVKKSGDFLVVLRNGVLHSVRISRNGAPVLERVDTLKVANDESGEDAWYDEILTFGQRLVLLGFNYGADKEVAELVLFTLDSAGRIHRDARYWVRTEDYFSASNYAARIQGDNLLLSMSLELDLQGEMAWPEWSRRDTGPSGWTPLIDVEELYFPIYTTTRPHLHVLLQCPIAKLGGAGLDCRTSGIIGADQSVFYASDTAMYLALPAWDEAAYAAPGFEEWRYREPGIEQFRQTAVFRVPYAQDELPVFARVDGRIDDQMRFKQDATGLYVATTDGPHAQQRLNLTYIPDTAFRPMRDPTLAPRAVLPLSEGQDIVRYSDTSVWIGTHRWSLEDDAALQSTDLLVQPLNGGIASTIRMPHSVDRLEPAFGGMVVSGSSGALPWKTPDSAAWRISFAREHSPPRLLSTIDVPAHLSAEDRSHAFNLGQLGDGTRLFGMPGWPKPALVPDDWNPEVLSDLVFMRLDGEQIRPAGIVSMQDAPKSDDCEDDCYDWYGNARLFFVGDRIFALSANQLKEARYRAGKVKELRRAELP